MKTLNSFVIVGLVALFVSFSSVAVAQQQKKTPEQRLLGLEYQVEFVQNRKLHRPQLALREYFRKALVLAQKATELQDELAATPANTPGLPYLTGEAARLKGEALQESKEVLGEMLAAGSSPGECADLDRLLALASTDREVLAWLTEKLTLEFEVAAIQAQAAKEGKQTEAQAHIERRQKRIAELQAALQGKLQAAAPK